MSTKPELLDRPAGIQQQATPPSSEHSSVVEFVRRQGNKISNVLSISLFLVAWELFSRFGPISQNLFPPPSKVVATLVSMTQSGMELSDVRISVIRALSGFILGSLIAVIVGLFTGRVPLVRALLEPVIQLFRPIPSIAFVPISIFWFGLGESSKLFLITYGVFFPVWLNTHVGVSTVEHVLIRAARSMGADGLKLFFQVILPASVPFVVAGLRQGIAVAFIVLVAAEMTGASSGVGFRIEQSHEIFRADRMMVGLMTLGVLGGLADMLFTKLSGKIAFWSPDSNEG